MNLGASQQAAFLHSLCPQGLLLEFRLWLDSGMECDVEVWSRQTLSSPKLLLVMVFTAATESKLGQAHASSFAAFCLFLYDPVYAPRETVRRDRKAGWLGLLFQVPAPRSVPSPLDVTWTLQTLVAQLNGCPTTSAFPLLYRHGRHNPLSYTVPKPAWLLPYLIIRSYSWSKYWIGSQGDSSGGKGTCQEDLVT